MVTAAQYRVENEKLKAQVRELGKKNTELEDRVECENLRATAQEGRADALEGQILALNGHLSHVLETFRMAFTPGARTLTIQPPVINMEPVDDGGPYDDLNLEGCRNMLAEIAFEVEDVLMIGTAEPLHLIVRRLKRDRAKLAAALVYILHMTGGGTSLVEAFPDDLSDDGSNSTLQDVEQIKLLIGQSRIRHEIEFRTSLVELGTTIDEVSDLMNEIERGVT